MEDPHSQSSDSIHHNQMENQLENTQNTASEENQEKFDESLHNEENAHSIDGENLTSEAAKPTLTEEEQLQRLYALQSKRRAERLEMEKKEEREREKNRIIQGKKTLEQLSKLEEQRRIIGIENAKKEKQMHHKESERQLQLLKQEWKERFGTEYNPDNSDENQKPTRSAKQNVAYWCTQIITRNKTKNHEMLKKCLNTLKTYISNALNNPNQPKFLSIRKENEAFKKRVAEFDGTLEFLESVGFKDDGIEHLTIDGPPNTFLIQVALKYLNIQITNFESLVK